MTTTFKLGDTVRFAAAFLKSVQWHTDVPDTGKVVDVWEDLVTVDWGDGDGTSRSHRKNLILASESHLEPA